jgi:hypothetical protein
MPQVTFQGKTYEMGAALPHVPLPPWFPAALTRDWEEIELPPMMQKFGARRGYDAVYLQRKGLRVIVSGAVYDDHRRWLHLSVSRKDTCMPTWDQMSLVKEVFLGPERQAIQVMPPRSKHVNIHESCLHLFCCLDGDCLPDFTAGGQTL